MKFSKAMENLRQKFTSGNDIPVRRATITLEEYQAIRDTLDRIMPETGVELKKIIEDYGYSEIADGYEKCRSKISFLLKEE